MTDIRKRLVKALHTSATLPALREELVLVLCDLEVDQTPTLRSVAPDVRTQADAAALDAIALDAAPDTEPESAPPTPVDSAVGQEFGP